MSSLGSNRIMGITDPLRTTKGIILNKNQTKVPNLQLEQAQDEFNLVECLKIYRLEEFV